MSAVDTAPYHDYQVVVRGRIIKLQDLDLEDARLALMGTIDLIDALDQDTARAADRIERWMLGKPQKK